MSVCVCVWVCCFSCFYLPSRSLTFAGSIARLSLSHPYVNKWYMYVVYCKWNELSHVTSCIIEKYAMRIIYRRFILYADPPTMNKMLMATTSIGHVREIWDVCCCCWIEAYWCSRLALIQLGRIGGKIKSLSPLDKCFGINQTHIVECNSMQTVDVLHRFS